MTSDAPDDPAPKRLGFLVWLRDSFAAGVVLVLPLVVTIWLILTVVAFIDTRVAPVAPTGLRPWIELIPGAGVIFALVALTVIGALTKNLLGRVTVQATERFITGLPIVRSIYGGSKQIVKQIAAPERTSFQQAVLVPFAGAVTIGFVTNDDTAEITGEGAEGAEDMVAVYVPQAPIPTTGFLLYYPRRLLRPIALGPEEALKRVISLGMARKEAPEARSGA